MNRRLFLVGAAVFTSALLASQTQGNSQETERGKLLSALQAGGHVIYFRHAEKSGDSSIAYRLPAQFRECVAPEVLLTEVGVASMKSLGQRFKQLNIPVGEVISSPACRCLESAWFSFEKVAIDPSLNGIYREDSAGHLIVNEAVNEQFATDLRRMLVKMPAGGSNTILFAHSSNILSLTGLMLEQGEATIFKPDGRGNFVYMSRLKLNDWEGMQGDSHRELAQV